jgi:hypothetical protein
LETAALSKLVAELLVAAQTLSGHGAPIVAPEVAFVAQAALAQQACSGPCAVYGWFPPDNTIYLEESLDLDGNVAARSILLHELVHFLQQETGAFQVAADCRTWMDRERQAYDVQLRWLAAQQTPIELLARLGFRPWKMACPDDGALTPGRSETQRE